MSLAFWAFLTIMVANANVKLMMVAKKNNKYWIIAVHFQRKNMNLRVTLMLILDLWIKVNCIAKFLVLALLHLITKIKTYYLHE